ncbi:MAG: TetR/AcrR family transcriptional regulator [Bacilli bacterium]|nr:TetR/AcrR family transcriptional regulator [Bacilli bacterium]
MKDTNRTKREFEKALFILLEKKNYHDIIVNEICALANKTKMTFYRNYKDKDALLAVASINLINSEYDIEYNKILKKETDVEEIEYLSLIATYELVARHYKQISNLIYKGEILPLEIFKRALFNNYKRYISELINSEGYDLPNDYMSIFCFEGLYETCLYYAEQLQNNKSKKKVKEDMRKICRLLAKAVISIIKSN